MSWWLVHLTWPLFVPPALVVRFLTKRFIWEYDPTLGRLHFILYRWYAVYNSTAEVMESHRVKIPSLSQPLNLL